MEGQAEGPVGARPIALGHHRYQWLHVTAFVQPTTGEAVWFLSTGLSKRLFEALLASFARQVGAGRARHVILVLDNAGWHGPKGLVVPDGVTLVFLPPYSPELQPAAPLALGGRAGRQPALRHARRPRRGGRRALPSARRHHDQATHQLPLVAELGSAELISRSSYHTALLMN